MMCVVILHLRVTMFESSYTYIYIAVNWRLFDKTELIISCDLWPFF